MTKTTGFASWGTPQKMELIINYTFDVNRYHALLIKRDEICSEPQSTTVDVLDEIYG